MRVGVVASAVGFLVVALACGGNIGGPIVDTAAPVPPMPVPPPVAPPTPTATLGSGDPLYGTTSVSPGSPTAEVEVLAGGVDAVAGMGLPGGCVGHIAAGQPDHRLVIERTVTPLFVGACAEEDTALIIRSPSGSMLCADDVEGRNPQIDLSGSAAGTYDIWVSRYSEGAAVDADLVITQERGGICVKVNKDGEPAATQSLARGFGQNRMPVTAGGGTDIGMVADLGCAGHIRSEGPNVRLTLGEGSGPLYIGACGAVDLTLAVHGPGDRWMCNDDYELNKPYVQMTNAPAGEYQVFVGTYSEEPDATAAVVFSETDDGPCSAEVDPMAPK